MKQRSDTYPTSTCLAAQACGEFCVYIIASLFDFAAVATDIEQSKWSGWLLDVAQLGAEKLPRIVCPGILQCMCDVISIWDRLRQLGCTSLQLGYQLLGDGFRSNMITDDVMKLLKHIPPIPVGISSHLQAHQGRLSQAHPLPLRPQPLPNLLFSVPVASQLNLLHRQDCLPIYDLHRSW